MSARTGPDGRGTLRALSPPLKEPCPLLLKEPCPLADEPEDDGLEFSDEEGRTLPAGGRGTDRFIAVCDCSGRCPIERCCETACEDCPPGRADIDSDLDPVAFGGRGTDRPGPASERFPAVAERPGMVALFPFEPADEDCPFGKPLPAEGFAMVLRELPFSTLRIPGPFDGAREAEMPDAREFPLAPILLTTGRLNPREVGTAARIPAVLPSIAARVGFALTRLKAGALRSAFCGT